MNQLDIWFLALALAMDCFAVSIASGIIVKKHIGKMMIRMAFLFGFFQAAMPLIGWFGVSTFTSYLENIDHWIAFGLLTFLGGRMIRESFLPEEEKKIKPRKLKTQVVLAIATSIDALAVGISFACTGFSNLKMLVYPLFIIGFVSFVMSITGVLLGVKFGKPIAKKFKPELLGGIILIFIGIKVLLSHLYGL
ncbi:MAG: manganese efflux pump [Prevotella sp.]|mgnify:FL=1|jgi:putative Mn2+ efflux pump MntP|nr:manganese efflux pump MntP family protein [Prevotella sp.]MBP6527666.1 manganese efflux pump [Prevotella sp.]MBP7098082.1 manganese efflux pump [Prevotella sp.]MBP8686110.1 manganese efflux pump [Prevotella sp.]MBP9983019.1 manganese efflux pump [Prevotella sp.]MCI1731961.1 manganese efflux pump MntP family protein [Prevotella sp.]